MFVAEPGALSVYSAFKMPAPMYFVSSVVVKRACEYVNHAVTCHSGDELKPPNAPTGPVWLR